MNLHNEIMNIQIDDRKSQQAWGNADNDCQTIYKMGHRDARHAAAELSLKAYARIEQLEEILQWYVDEDEIHEGDPENQYWIDGKHKAIKLLESK